MCKSTFFEREIALTDRKKGLLSLAGVLFLLYKLRVKRQTLQMRDVCVDQRHREDVVLKTDGPAYESPNP